MEVLVLPQLYVLTEWLKIRVESDQMMSSGRAAVPCEAIARLVALSVVLPSRQAGTDPGTRPDRTSAFHQVCGSEGMLTAFCAAEGADGTQRSTYWSQVWYFSSGDSATASLAWRRVCSP